MDGTNARRSSQERRGMTHLSRLCDHIVAALESAPSGSPLRHLVDAVTNQIHVAAGNDQGATSATELLGQTLLLTRVFWAHASRELRAVARRIGLVPESMNPIHRALRETTQRAVCPGRRANRSTDETPDIQTLLDEVDQQISASDRNQIRYDVWLAKRDRRMTSRWGVYYTPLPIVRYMVRATHELLISEFKMRRGLADQATWEHVRRHLASATSPTTDSVGQPFVRVLDPAMGDGAFLIEVIERVHQTLFEEGEISGERSGDERWTEYVDTHLLGRLLGIELMLPQAVLAWFRMADKLATTGYLFERAPILNLWLGDALRPLESECGSDEYEGPPGPGSRMKTAMEELRPTVILGNPPFSALTTSGNAWTDQLLRKFSAGSIDLSSYYEVDGRALAEKKLWLHDDYVKFIRLAQWHIARSGVGLVSFITNHGYLDNLTFRGMRQSLLETFNRVELLDLHGNRKKWEVSPDGSPDENVFGIDQGTAIGVFVRGPEATGRRVHYGELWGDRSGKLAALDDFIPPSTAELHPSSPNYFLAPRKVSTNLAAEYERGIPLNEVMPLYGSAAVTARDGFAIAFTRQELESRLDEFCSLTLDDASIRSRYFQRTRSRRFQRGDTRGWQLENARRAAKAHSEVGECILSCQYRPLDWRYIAWADWMIDWPRPSVMRHMIGGENLALVTRRQMPLGQPANFFFLSNTVVIDGLLRSDNRGNESFFPLYELSCSSPDTRRRNGNFSRQFVERCASRWGIEWRNEESRGDFKGTFSPRDLFALIYAQFFSSDYRERYAEFFSLGFPRVLVPKSPEQAQVLCQLGAELIDAHSRKRSSTHTQGWTCDESVVAGEGKYPFHRDDSIHVNEHFRIDGVSREIWDYRLGTHQVCRKWLKDRRGRVLNRQSLDDYREAIAVIRETIAIVRKIDRSVASWGGWPEMTSL